MGMRRFTYRIFHHGPWDPLELRKRSLCVVAVLVCSVVMRKWRRHRPFFLMTFFALLAWPSRALPGISLDWPTKLTRLSSFSKCQRSDGHSQKQIAILGLFYSERAIYICSSGIRLPWECVEDAFGAQKLKAGRLSRFQGEPVGSWSGTKWAEHFYESSVKIPKRNVR